MHFPYQRAILLNDLSSAFNMSLFNFYYDRRTNWCYVGLSKTWKNTGTLLKQQVIHYMLCRSKFTHSFTSRKIRTFYSRIQRARTKYTKICTIWKFLYSILYFLVFKFGWGCPNSGCGHSNLKVSMVWKFSHALCVRFSLCPGLSSHKLGNYDYGQTWLYPWMQKWGRSPCSIQISVCGWVHTTIQAIHSTSACTCSDIVRSWY